MKKLFAVLSSAVAFVYTVWYMHFGVPYENSGALSKIGLEHKGYFVVWGLLTLLALSFNTVIAYRRYTETRVYIPFLVLSAIGMLMTLCFDFDFNLKPDYYIHCVGSLMFSVIMGVTVFVLFALCFNKGAVFEAFTYITGAILVIDLILLLVYKETGLIETVPIFAGYIMLGVVNFDSHYPIRRDKIEAYR